MTTAPRDILGRLVWTELMTTDMKAAEAFYDKVIGWASEPFADSAMPYTAFNRSGPIPVAGLMERPAGMNMPPFWSMYIAVPRFEDALAQIKKLGGHELSEVIDIPDIGRMQMVKDPQGAAFYIIQPAPRDNPPVLSERERVEGPDGEPEVGEASWLELMTTDQPAATTFYQQIFGWQPTDAMDMGDMGTYQMFNRGTRMLGGMMNKPKELADVPPHWRIYFLVPDINSAAERIKVNGGTIMMGPMEVPGGDWVLNAMDPQGAAFALHAKKA
jgi:predicted enzyme related to lactoylglutathione lyase